MTAVTELLKQLCKSAAEAGDAPRCFGRAFDQPQQPDQCGRGGRPQLPAVNRHWEPRDLFDVQGFAWVALDGGWIEDADDETTDESDPAVPGSSAGVRRLFGMAGGHERLRIAQVDVAADAATIGGVLRELVTPSLTAAEPEP